MLLVDQSEVVLFYLKILEILVYVDESQGRIIQVEMIKEIEFCFLLYLFVYVVNKVIFFYYKFLIFLVINLFFELIFIELVVYKGLKIRYVSIKGFKIYCLR